MLMQKGFAHLLILIIISILIIATLIFWWSKNNNPNVRGVEIMPQNATTSSANSIFNPVSTPTPTPFPQWKTYSNSQYHFEITYPYLGVIMTENGFAEGECGKAIKESGSEITFDNFFKIKMINFAGSIDEYLASQGALNKYNLENIASGSADQVLKLAGLKQGVEYAVGYPPLAYVSQIYKKGDLILQISSIQNPNNFGGCLSPDKVDPVKFAAYKNLKWKLENNLRFTSP